MCDPYGEGHAVAYFEKGLRPGQKSLMYGLIMKSSGTTVSIVRVFHCTEHTRFYDEAINEKDPCKDNVPLSDCPPPFSDLCDLDMLPDNATGTCFAFADMNNLIVLQKTECDPIEPDEAVSEETLNLVRNHPIPVQAGNGEFTYGSGDGRSRPSFAELWAKKDHAERMTRQAARKSVAGLSVADVERSVAGMAASAEAKRNDGLGHDGLG